MASKEIMPMIKSKKLVGFILVIQLFSISVMPSVALAKSVSKPKVVEKVQVRPIENTVLAETRIALQLLNAPPERLEQLTKSCYSAGFANDIDPVLIACIIKPESNFKIDGVSNKGCKSLMGTREAVLKWSHAAYNIMKGACDLREKLGYTHGNMYEAMVKYKGRGGKESQHFAKTQLALYHDIKKQTKLKMCELEKQNNIVLAELM
jgi:hypothetical protein